MAAMAAVTVACGGGAPRESSPAAPRALEGPRDRLEPTSLGTAMPVLDGALGAGTWVPSSTAGKWHLEGDALVIEPGGSPFDLEREVALDAARLHTLEVTLSSGYKVQLSLSWRRNGEAGWLDDALSLTYDEGTGARQRKTFTFDLRSDARWSGAIDRLRLRLIAARPAERIVLRRLRGFRQEVTTEMLAELSRRPWRVELDREIRAGLVAPPGFPVERQIAVPEVGGTLDLALGATGRLAAAITARVLAARPGDEPALLFESRLEPVARASNRRWRQARVDLGAFAGERLVLRFDSQADEGYDPTFGLPAWANPAVVSPRAELDHPNIILISVDTLRADRLSVYGNPRLTSPSIDAWARRFAVIFENAVAQAPWTLPSHGSMLTGLGALRHGVNHPFRAAPDELTTLAERLRAEGYTTAAITGGGWLHPGYGLAQGYDRYRYGADAGRGDRELESHAPVAARWLGALREPFFLFLHTYDVHDYRAPEREPSTASETPADSDADLARAYDRAIAHMDTQLGDVLMSFEALGLRGRSIVALTSDHGEDLGEDGFYGHGSLRDQVLLVPLILETPGGRGAGRTIAQQVRSIDLVPTLLDLAGLEVPAELDGVSLRRLIEGGAPVPPAWGSAYFASDGRLALRFDNRWKYVYNSSAWVAEDAREALFELPGEAPGSDDVAPDHPRLVDYRQLTRRLLTERLAGLRLRFENRTSGPFDGSIRGELIRAGVPKSIDAPALTRTGDAVADFSIAPGRRFDVLFEEVGEPRFELAAFRGEADGQVVTIDLETMTLPLVLRWTGSRWVTGPGAGDDARVTLEWHLRSGLEDAVPFEQDPELRRQLEALGYLQ